MCAPTSQTSCHDEEKSSCSLVSDVACRNVTETRFDEKCWTVEEDICKTVYDTVKENKCEMVNITIPQTECQTLQETSMQTVCKPVNSTMKRQMCITVMEKDVNKVVYNSMKITNNLLLFSLRHAKK